MRVFALFIIAALSSAASAAQARRGEVTDLDGRGVRPLDATPGQRATALIFMRD